ncbi:MAG TPA: hypothetical protein VFC78_17230 [Tepidisphaeraceae bacterium]|nr:hypothetical protein [Tepidisphaeraceae bacterium]
MPRRRTFVLVACLTCLAVCFAAPALAAPATQPARYFGIEVVDDQTGRGVPLVELKTVANVRYYTDSAGLAAIDDPVLMGKPAFFFVASHGYEFPPDGFGNRGARLDVKAGGFARLKIKRINIAQRLYRLTGEGIYRDSVMLGRPTPIRQPLLDAQVSGQDSALAAVYRGRIRWFFGDTLRPSYPLGQYWTSGATSQLPADGGLDPSVGVNLDYFVDDAGFSRGVLPREKGPSWLDGLMVLKDDAGNDRMIAKCSLMKSLGECVGRKLVVWNDRAQRFDYLLDIPLTQPLYPAGHPFRVQADGQSWFYFGQCFPNMRVPADWKSVRDLSAYEAFTCLAPGSRFDKETPKLDRDAAGRLIWGWKKNTAALEGGQISRLIKSGKLKADDVWFHPVDVETHKPLALEMGSVSYNAFAKKWIMIAGQKGGDSSFLGEIYFAQSPRPEGPWPWARKIVTHNQYSFYNPVHHDFFDQQGGRVIYFQGTYTATFSRTTHPTPRYEYNQIMYRLDLDDPRLKWPAPEK